MALFLLRICSIKLPVALPMLKVQVIGPTLFALPAPNLSSSAVSVLRKSQPSKNDTTPSKRRTRTKTSNNSGRSSNALLILGVPSTAKTVWTSCSLPNPSYAVRMHLLGISLIPSPISFVLIFSQSSFDIGPLIIFTTLTACFLTRPTTFIHALHLSILKLSTSRHLPPLR